MIRVSDLTVKYGDFEAVKNVTFELKEGHWLMVTGPNGAGKSTIVNALSGSVKYEGLIELNGKNILKMRSRDIAKKIGFLSQNHFVGYGFSVHDVIGLGGYSHDKGMLGDGGSREERIRRAADKTGMTDFLDTSVLMLSGGELQRVFLAQLFMQEPDILVLDEPTNHLDLIYQKQILKMVDEWKKQSGHAVISVVHDLSLAKLFGTHAILLEHGKAVGYGRTEDILIPSKLNKVYNMDVSDWMNTILKIWE